MTLGTHIRVEQPVAVKPLFDYVNRLLGFNPEVHAYFHERESDSPHMMYRNRLGQGLPALMSVTYGMDGPLDDSRYDPHPDDDPNDYEPRPPQAVIEIWLDTGYAYRTANGGSCSDLHAWLITKIGEYLDEHHVKWHWQNEFTGEWFVGLDLEGLAAFGNADKGALPGG